jgi:serine/threonine protein kinase
VAGKINKSKADVAADTVTSPSPPPYGPDPPAPAVPRRSKIDSGSKLDGGSKIDGPSNVDGRSNVDGARSSERVIPTSTAKSGQGCLDRDEVRAYLRPGCPRSLRDRVEGHTSECIACQQWVRHIHDEVLEYVGGQRPEEELARMDAHLEACTTCRDLVHHMVQRMARSWTGEERDVPDSSTTFSPGAVVNSRYRVLSFVGRGGMGEVYEAYDQLMDRRIALKTVLCTVADRPRAARRFKEEVRNAQRVGHPNVCRINDLQEHHDGVFGPAVPFFTMEFIEGDRLGNRLMAAPLPIADVRIIALQLLSGLEAAHTRGVLHLDFKSDNVMLRRDTKAPNAATPDAVIMDFGLSRVLGNESRLRTSDRRQFAGTLPYMSVEQLECREDLGPATDIYAFGVVVYEMLTRALPFEGDSLGAVLLKQLKERPRPPSRLVPELTPALDRFVLKCLHSDPRARFTDASQARAALESIAHWSRPRGAARARKLIAPLAVVGFIAAVIATSNMRQTATSTAPSASPEAAPSNVGSAPVTAAGDLQSVTNGLMPATSVGPGPAVPPLLPADPSSGGALAPSAEGSVGPSPAGPSEPAAAPPVPTAHASADPTVPQPARRVEPEGAAKPPARAHPLPASAPPLAPTAPDTRASSAPAESQPEPVPTGSTSWKPARVPKRLSAPSPADATGSAQNRP